MKDATALRRASIAISIVALAAYLALSDSARRTTDLSALAPKAAARRSAERPLADAERATGYLPESDVTAPRHPGVEVPAPRPPPDPALTAPARDNPNGVDGSRPPRPIPAL